MTFETKLQHAFQQGLALPDNTPYQELEFAKSSGWDSIAHLYLIAALEAEFGIMIETKDVLAMNSYNKAKELMSKYVTSLS